MAISHWGWLCCHDITSEDAVNMPIVYVVKYKYIWFIILLLQKHEMKKLQPPAGRAVGVFNGKSMGVARGWLRTIRYYSNVPPSCKIKTTSTNKLLRNKEYRYVAEELIKNGVNVAIKGKGVGMRSEVVADDLAAIMNCFSSCPPIIDGPFRGHIFYKDECGNYCEK